MVLGKLALKISIFLTENSLEDVAISEHIRLYVNGNLSKRGSGNNFKS